MWKCNLPYILFVCIFAIFTKALEIGYPIPALPPAAPITYELHAYAQATDGSYTVSNVTDVTLWTVYFATQTKPSLSGRLTSFTQVNSSAPSDSNWLAWVSCDTNTSITTGTDTFASANDQGALAIVMYAINSSTCDVYRTNSTWDEITVFSTIDHAKAKVINNLVTNPPNGTSIHATIVVIGQEISQNGTVPPITPPSQTNTISPSSTSASSLDNGQGANKNLAMNILYGIVGCVAFLFLLLIISGIIRAVRNPERYGFRTTSPDLADPTRPPQSRAAGIARAMLESFPIIQFHGKQEYVENGNSEVSKDKKKNSSVDEPKENEKPSILLSDVGWMKESKSFSEDADIIPMDSISSPQKSEKRPLTRQPKGRSRIPPPGAPAVGNIDNQTTCPICVDDFTPGEELRILPCKHQFHPSCIDPWLLNHSTICPLCRYDFSLMSNAASYAFDMSSPGPTFDVQNSPDCDLPDWALDDHFPPDTSASESRLSRYILNARQRFSRTSQQTHRSLQSFQTHGTPNSGSPIRHSNDEFDCSSPETHSMG